MTKLVLDILGILAAIVAGIFTIRKVMGWLFPIRIAPSVFIQLSDLGPDEIRAAVTNRSREPLYIIKCRGRSANSMGHILRTHLKKPLTKPRLYPCIWFGPQVYDLMGPEPIKIEPDQPINLLHRLRLTSPIFAFTTPMLQVEVVISSGRIFRSPRIPIPNRWHVAYQIKSLIKEDNSGGLSDSG
jgi:hypothetical protein